MRTGESLRDRPLRSADGAKLGSWVIAGNADGRTFYVTHAGTHDLSMVDFPALLAKLQLLAAPKASLTAATELSRRADDHQIRRREGRSHGDHRGRNCPCARPRFGSSPVVRRDRASRRHWYRRG